MTTQALQKTEQEMPVVPADMDAASLELAIGMGDVSRLAPEQRLKYIGAICRSMRLNPLTLPIRIIKLDGRDQLYATSECGAQLRENHQVSIEILDRKVEHDCYVITAKATKPNGRKDEATGAVPLVYPDKVWDRTSSRYVPHPKAGQPMTGLDYANAIKKCETQAKRRAALSICGLGIMDESEIDDIKKAKVESVSSVEDVETVSDRAAALNAEISQPVEAEIVTPAAPESGSPPDTKEHTQNKSASGAAPSSVVSPPPQETQPAPQSAPQSAASASPDAGSAPKPPVHTGPTLPADILTKVENILASKGPEWQMTCVQYLRTRGLKPGCGLETLSAQAANFIVSNSERFHKRVEEWSKQM